VTRVPARGFPRVEALLLQIAKAAEGLDRAEVLIDTRRGKTAVLCPIER